MISHFSKSAARLFAVFALLSLLLQAAENIAEVTALTGRNCIASHSPSENQAKWISSQLAPRLTDLGSRVSPDSLQRYLISPVATMAGTTMPDLLHGDANHTITSAKVSDDGLTVRLVVDHLVPGHVHELHLPGVRNRAGEPLFHDAAYSALNQIPKS